MKIEYCLHDATPAIIVDPDDGRLLGFEYYNGRWEKHSAAEISHEAVLITELAFKKMFPGIGLPKDINS